MVLVADVLFGIIAGGGHNDAVGGLFHVSRNDPSIDRIVRLVAPAEPWYIGGQRLRPVLILDGRMRNRDLPENAAARKCGKDNDKKDQFSHNHK